MGLGDNLLATGMARGAKARGKRIAFGDGQNIIWDHHSGIVFQKNPNIALPGDEQAADVEWIAFHRGNRQYNRHDSARNRWVWNYEFKATPGEMFFSRDELMRAERFKPGFVLIEPHVPTWKSSALNKTWAFDRYEAVARSLMEGGYEVRQFIYGNVKRLRFARPSPVKNFRDALAILSGASLYIGPEGGMHHGAAAVDIPAVVLFGGFIPPQVTGYDTHTNLTGGAEACGSLSPCDHCRKAMDAIKVSDVLDPAIKYLGTRQAA